MEYDLGYDEILLSSSDEEEEGDDLVNDSKANTERPQLGNHVTDSNMEGVTRSPAELYENLRRVSEQQAGLRGDVWVLVKGENATIVRQMKPFVVGLLSFILSRGNMYNRLANKVWPQMPGDDALNARLVTLPVDLERITDFWCGSSLDASGVLRYEGVPKCWSLWGLEDSLLPRLHFVPIWQAVGATPMRYLGWQGHKNDHPKDGALLSSWWDWCEKSQPPSAIEPARLRVLRPSRRMPSFVANGKPKMPMVVVVKVLPSVMQPKLINQLRSKNELLVLPYPHDSEEESDEVTGFTALIFANGASHRRNKKDPPVEARGKVVLVGIKSKRKFEEACETLEGILRLCGYSEAKLVCHHESNMVYKGNAGHRIDLDRMAHEIQQSYILGRDRTISLRKPRSSHEVYRFPGLFVQVGLVLFGEVGNKRPLEEYRVFTVICFDKGSIVMPGVKLCGGLNSDEVAYQLFQRVKEVVRPYITSVGSQSVTDPQARTGLELKPDWWFPPGITTTLLTAFK